MGVLRDNKHYMDFLIREIKKSPIFLSSNESDNAIYSDGEDAVMVSLKGAKVEAIELRGNVVAIGIPLQEIKFVKIGGKIDVSKCEVSILGSAEKVIKSDSHLILMHLHYEKNMVVYFYDKYKNLG